ncbi:hypothetical protein [Candidatus Mycobacterium methanotrophicum]|uniref:Uncharacterized protein n=1 Tax=Candidatus Mycobacterium methanotrophicum TaxID=2943498 RepID=A0ABY4QNX1_9MYCO|nr:hypothetical protein [Candidatus Mycobacterium methanotrophicum]UQX12197.1 hypothetical protein M5I08_07860 [Candidatus Mycobacterium methanotrophicum]
MGPVRAEVRLRTGASFLDNFEVLGPALAFVSSMAGAYGKGSVGLI